MAQTDTQWTGTPIAEFTLTELIGEGSYSWVYRGVHSDGVRQRAFKIAKPPDLAGRPDPERLHPTQAIGFRSGGLTPLHPDASQLLLLQARKIQAVSDPALIFIEEIIEEEGMTACQMELIDGKTLRDIMEGGPVPVRVMIEIARSVQRLAADPRFEYHGDLKPENIFVTEGGIKLIDPGHFGPLDTQEGAWDPCIVTTPEYYPLLTADDLFALGIVLWEAAVDRHPLASGGTSAQADLSQVGEDLRNLVRYKELTGQYFLSPILECGRPSLVRPGLPPEVERVLLDGLRLRITDDGKIDKAAGCESFEDLIAALEGLVKAGIRQL